jgi:hypothetical protein
MPIRPLSTALLGPHTVFCEYLLHRLLQRAENRISHPPKHYTACPFTRIKLGRNLFLYCHPSYGSTGEAPD